MSRDFDAAGRGRGTHVSGEVQSPPRDSAPPSAGERIALASPLLRTAHRRVTAGTPDHEADDRRARVPRSALRNAGRAAALCSALASACAASTEAADLLGQVALKAPPRAAPLHEWTGLYVGGHVAYGRGHARGSLSDLGPTASNDWFGSLYGGVQAGYNFVLPSRLLFGLEADITFPNFLEDGGVSTHATAQSTVTDKIDYIGTWRGRFGYAFDQWLVYGTGGFAWSGARFLESPGITNDQDQVLRTRTGWALGLGAEVAVAPDWTARLEYLYDHFGGVSGVFPSGTRYESAFDFHAVRLGLDRRLDWPNVYATSVDTGDAPPAKSDNWNIHGQFTFIEQGYPAFHSPYEGANSLTGSGQAKSTASATAFIGFRPWDGTEIYVDPELMQGFGLSGTLGLAGFPNGEAQKSDFPAPRFNIARVFLRQTFGLGGEEETIEDGPNQLGGKQDISRITLTAGKFAVTDIFDGNAFANDPRTTFLNWNIYGGGSYDWTMDKISYTWGAVTELDQKQWALRFGYFLVPTVSNVNTFDTHIPDRGEYAGELELRYSLFSQPGKLRLFGWANRATAGSYSDALALPATTASFPDITLTRRVRTNYGFVVNAEQAITDDLGLFSRASWDAGRTEKIGWTDCDASLSLGAVLKGTSWGRPDDKVGVGGVVEALSPEARDYFAAGGLGILIGDGQLNYRQEGILETYYAYSLNTWATLSFDYQLIANPGYNADRGPVSIFSGRLHAEF
jgi:high affinity Mn2+ porin